MRDSGKCHCEKGPSFDRDYEFVDETGFVCTGCDSNVFYDQDPTTR